MPTSTTSPAKAARKDGKSNGSSRTSAVERQAPATAASAVSSRPSDEEIALRAYEIYEREGRQPGTELQNWLRAEAELCGPKGH